jgi:hypothetical protein
VALGADVWASGREFRRLFVAVDDLRFCLLSVSLSVGGGCAGSLELRRSLFVRGFAVFRRFGVTGDPSSLSEGYPPIGL